MALHFIDKEDLQKVYRNNANAVYFDSTDGIHRRFCDCLELESEYNLEPVLNKPLIREYLNLLEIEYDGNYRVGSKNWDGFPLDYMEWRFVTHLAYWVQTAIVMLNYENKVFICETSSALDIKYSPFVLKRRDLYYVMNNWFDMDIIREYIDAGVPVYYKGNYMNNLSVEEFDSKIYTYKMFVSSISKELDAEVFPKDFLIKSFKPITTTFQELATKFNERLLDNAPDDLQIVIKAETLIGNAWRKYPIYHLFLHMGKWYFMKDVSVKYPNQIELLKNVSYWLDNEDYAHSTIVHEAEKVISLVLDCNEIYDARKYLDFVGFVSIYDRKNRILEICNKEEGILLFHQKLQESLEIE